MKLKKVIKKDEKLTPKLENDANIIDPEKNKRRYEIALF